MTASTTWKVGALAQASGLTVRTLHHWDTIGILSPSRRTTGGHREYTEQDLVRLYQVLALRRLGLGLETIATCLDVGVDPVRLVGDHLATVEAAIASLNTLRQRLERIGDELAAGRAPQVPALLQALRATGGTGPESDSVLRRHLDDDQLHTLQARTAALGPTAHYLLEIEWPELYRRAEALRAAGTAPAAPEVRRLVARMDELSTLFSGGDSTLSGAVKAAWRDDPAAVSGDTTTPADTVRDLADYLDQARAATH